MEGQEKRTRIDAKAEGTEERAKAESKDRRGGRKKGGVIHDFFSIFYVIIFLELFSFSISGSGITLTFLLLLRSILD